ncbi:Acetylornithine deacetylase or succinyl-diaminopimelate desuccinylase [[Clostridium] ultunense Esp]|jgi:acetylornithine deacetylase/succinyl-diaminopimelate desuccinylase|uniref:Probable succinyl-diaminopimelate desuccinylase n=1 Tax=[Clostridium] ultunense Esp TaxID=1288971 RepID=M1ZA36_9FIRM|nr:M20 family metallopeptidase [Schnuerera ultunensis]CCQ94709.1 Acetylornithine deacetylase or succinyl-diaminopimelate desuccinylase [[Clostridium] ultunense Esp]SHD76588.1 Acetylornithine deacetylase or succinyl-diaminopimelate desuccinylase [[Clostridium] ultunense Esp]
MIDFDKYYDQKELIKLTQDLIKIPSHKDVPNREKEVVDFIYRFCKENELEVELQDVDGARKNVLVYLRGTGNGKTLMFNGHTDTVPPYNMTIDPFKAEVKDGYIWGRGASDMKGPIASMLISMLAIKRSGIKLKGDIIFAGVLGEEEQSEGTEMLVKSGIKADGCIVGEPSNYEYAIGHRGLEWIEIKVKGKAAHGGVPNLGINAISKAAKLILKIEEEIYPKLKERFNEYMGPSVMNFGRIEGGSQPSTVADWCSIILDRRYIPGEDVESVFREYQDVIDALKEEDPDFDAELIRMEENFLTLDHLYLMTDPKDPIVLSTKNAIRKVTGREPEITRRRGWTDAALLSNFAKIPTVVTGPGNIAYSHTKDERVEIKHLIDYVDVYGKIAMEFCGVE